MVDWSAWREVGLSVDAASGFAFIALGAWVGWMTPRTRAAVVFSAMAIAIGVRYAVGNLVSLGVLASTTWLSVLYLLANVVSTVALLWILVEFPRRLHAAERRRLLLPAAAALALLGLTLVLHLGFGAEPSAPQEITTRLEGTADDVAGLAWTLLLAFLLLRRPGLDVGARRSVYFVSLGLVLLPAISAGREIVMVANMWETGAWATLVLRSIRPVIVLGLAAAWLTARGDAETRRQGRNVGLVALGAQCFGALLAAWAGPEISNDLGFHGLARFMGAAVLAYAILRHQLFDINVKLRKGIKQSTVAAIVVAAFVGVQTFVSEFSTDKAGLAGGALVTAALVLAIAPLQRLGDRVARAAVPDATPIAAQPVAEREEFYRGLAESAWADGSLTRSERRVLDAARERLGLDRETAGRIEEGLSRA